MNERRRKRERERRRDTLPEVVGEGVEVAVVVGALLEGCQLAGHEGVGIGALLYSPLLLFIQIPSYSLVFFVQWKIKNGWIISPL